MHILLYVHFMEGTHSNRNVNFSDMLDENALLHTFGVTNHELYRASVFPVRDVQQVPRIKGDIRWPAVVCQRFGTGIISPSRTYFVFPIYQADGCKILVVIKSLVTSDIEVRTFLKTHCKIHANALAKTTEFGIYRDNPFVHKVCKH